MFKVYRHILLLSVAILAVGVSTRAQESNDFGQSITGKKDAPSKTLQETMDKMRIARDKKDLDEMIGRGEEVQKIAADLEKAYELNAKLTPEEMVKLESVEKLVKKIRTELGGENDDSDDPEPDTVPAAERNRPLSLGDAIKTLRDSTIRLYTELKKTTRFSISVVSIQTANAVLRLTRFLKITH